MIFSCIIIIILRLIIVGFSESYDLLVLSNLMVQRIRLRGNSHHLEVDISIFSWRLILVFFFFFRAYLYIKGYSVINETS